MPEAPVPSRDDPAPGWSPLLEGLPLGVLLANAQGQYLEANTAAWRILGIEREMLVGSNLPKPRANLLTPEGSVLAPEDTPAAVTLRTGKPVSRKVMGVVQASGDTLWLEVSAEPIPGGSVLVTFEDITRHQLTEAILAARARLAEQAPTATLEEILRATLDEAEHLTGSCIGFFHFVESDQETLTLQAWSTRTEAEFCRAEGKGMPYAVNQAEVWVDAIHARKPVIHNDYASLPHMKGLPEGHATVLRELVVPILRDDRIVAILSVGNKPFPYGNRDLQAVQRLADLAWDLAERKRMETALRECEQRWHTLVELAGDGFELLDEEGRYLQVNASSCQSLGYTREEMLQQTICDIDPTLTPDSYRTRFKDLIGRPPATFETIYRRKDGSTFPAEVTVSMIRLGEQQRALAQVRDITDRKQGEKSLRATKDLLNLVLDSLEAHVAILDAAGNILAVNEPWRAFAHENGILTTLGTVEQVNYLDVLACPECDPVDGSSGIRLGVLGVLGGTLPSFQADYPCNSPTEQRWFRMHVLPLGPGQQGAVITHENITAEKLANLRLEKAHEQLSFAQRAAGAGVWEWNLTDNHLTWSKELFHLYGLDQDRDQADFATFRRIVHGDDLATVDANMARMLAEQSPFSNEYRIVLPDGHVRWIRAHGSFDLNPEGEPIRMAGICLDHTLQRMAELAQAASERQAQVMLRTALDGVWLIDEAGRFREANETACRMLGYSREELLALSLAEVEVQENPVDVLNHLAKISAQGWDLFESRHRRKNGSEFPVELSVTHHPDLHQLVVFTRDISDRKEADTALRESEARFRAMFEDSPIGLWEEDFSEVKASFDALRHRGVIDLRTHFDEHPEEVARIAGQVRVLSVNQASILSLKAKSKEAILRNLPSYFTEASLEAFKEELLALASGQTRFSVETPHLDALGDFRIFDLGIAVQTGSEDSLSRVLVSFLDITKKKQASDALRASEAKLKTLTEHAPDHILLLDLEGRILYINHVLPGYELNDVIGQNWLNWMPVAAREIAASAMAQVIETGRRMDYTVNAAGSPGETLWYDCRLSPVHEEGVLTGLALFTTDITERRHSELALFRSERQYRGLFDSMKEGFALHEILTDETGQPFDYRFLDVNPAFVQMTGLSRERWIGHTVREILPGIEPSRIREYGRVALTGQSITFEDEAKELGRWYRVTAYQPAPRQFSVLITDITRQKRAERERQELEQQLARTQKLESLGSLAGGVAHDMNNVLGAIMGLASIHEELAPAGSRMQKSMDTILKACTRGRTLVKGLLGFARQGLEEIRRLDLNEVIQEQVALLERTIPANVHLEVDLVPGLRPIQGDAASLSHVLMNLCVNALDAMPTGGTLSLRTLELDPDSACLEVEDTGCGMSTEVLEKAMDPFFTTKAQGKGTGLGLAIVYGTVKAHHGRVELTSTPGAGTRVRMHFPASEVATALQDAGPQRAARSQSLQVLLVDDDELIQDSLSEMLRSLGHVPTVATSGEEALFLLNSGLQADVVVLDLNMPGLGGVGTLPLLRERYPELPVLLATGRPDQMAMNLVATTTKTVLLPKPFSAGEIASHFSKLGLA